MGKVLCKIINSNQSAFIPSRRTIDNILMVHELVRNYHRDSGPPRYVMKVDLRKAWDSVS